MRIGLQIPNFTWNRASDAELAPKLAEIVKTADEGGFYSIWVMDHFFQIAFAGPPENEMMESYTTLSYFAGLTKKVKLGTLVTGIVYRYPGILVKTVTTLDVLSGGRAYLGIGAAWFEQEARGLGTPFPPTKERFEQLEETLQIAKQMWSDNDGAYNGKHYQLAQTLCHPQPLSKPHPPIMIGGMGEQKTMRFVAKYADACNLFEGAGIETIRHRIGLIKQYCEEIGRDYNEIERTTLGSVHLADGAMKADDVIARCKVLAAEGVQHAIFNMPNVQDITPLEIFAREIIPAVADL